MKKKTKVKINTKRFIASSVIVVLIFTIIFAIGIKQLNITPKTKGFIEKKMKLNFKDRITDLANYKYEDYFTVGWLQVQGTNIDYPILNHNASSIDPTKVNFGWRTPLYQSGQNKEVIIGHNIINVSSEPIRNMEILNNFEGLMAFTYEDFAKDNLYISYTKGDSNDIYKIFGAYFKTYNEESTQSIGNSEKIKEYIDSVFTNSIYDYNVDVNENDKIIVIKTCTRYFGVNENQEFLIIARKLRDNEEITKYQVTKNDNYKIVTEGISKENG